MKAVRQAVRPEKYKGHAHVGKSKKAAEPFLFDRKELQAVKGNADPVKQPPEHEGPVGTVPQAADQKGDQGVYDSPGLSPAASSQRKIDIGL